jgi:hypothetical protein
MIGLAIAAAEQENQDVVGKVLDGVLLGGGITGSGRPESLTTPVLEMRIRPCGATIRLHQLPNASR